MQSIDFIHPIPYIDGILDVEISKVLAQGQGKLQREDAVKEAVQALEVVCRTPDNRYMISYVRLRVFARNI